MGQNYTVTFWMAGNPICPAGIRQLSIGVQGAAAIYSFDTTGKTTSNMGWVQKTYTFQALFPQTTLVFGSITSGSYGPALDGPITVTP